MVRFGSCRVWGRRVGMFEMAVKGEKGKGEKVEEVKREDKEDNL